MTIVGADDDDACCDHEIENGQNHLWSLKYLSFTIQIGNLEFLSLLSRFVIWNFDHYHPEWKF